jgi:hypothetical protein
MYSIQFQSLLVFGGLKWRNMKQSLMGKAIKGSIISNNSEQDMHQTNITYTFSTIWFI